MRKIMFTVLMTACLAFVGAANAVVINEWVSNDTSTDDREFIELCGMPGESLDGLTIVLVEGEGTGSGIIDKIISLNGYVVNAMGYFVIGDAAVNPDLELAAGWIENGGNNILLLADFDEQLYPIGTDIDAEDDCVADFSIGTVVDGVGYGRPDLVPPDCIVYYGIVGVGPDGSYDPAGGARCDDCDAIGGEWYIICLNGTEPTDPGCTVADGYYISYATPGASNACAPVSNEASSWGGVKSMYR
jgi:hypothetical protein